MMGQLQKSQLGRYAEASIPLHLRERLIPRQASLPLDPVQIDPDTKITPKYLSRLAEIDLTVVYTLIDYGLLPPLQRSSGVKCWAWSTLQEALRKIPELERLA